MCNRKEFTPSPSFFGFLRSGLNLHITCIVFSEGAFLRLFLLEEVPSVAIMNSFGGYLPETVPVGRGAV